MSRYGIALLLMGFSLTAQAGDYVFVGAESFQWHEYDTDGSQFLAESGPRLMAGFNRIRDGGGGSISQLGMRFYIGDVFYDGQLIDSTPFQSTTGYTGFSLEHKYQEPLGSNLYGELGEGLEFWQRVLDKGGTHGYLENYLTFYVRAGLGVGRVERGWHGNFGVKYPLMANEIVQDYPYDTVQLQPSPTASLYVEFGYAYPDKGWGLFYDGYRFEASPWVARTQNGIYTDLVRQPTSVMDRWGIRFYTRY